jgi:hypothetical protein
LIGSPPNGADGGGLADWLSHCFTVGKSRLAVVAPAQPTGKGATRPWGRREVGEIDPDIGKRLGRIVGKAAIMLANKKCLTDLKGRQTAIVVWLGWEGV